MTRIGSRQMGFAASGMIGELYASRRPSSGMRLRSAAAVATLAMAGCDWIALAKGAATYETLKAGGAGNVVATASLAYVTLADSGIAVIDARTGVRLARIPPPTGLQSVDDLAIADNVLIALDAQVPGALAVLSLRDPRHPQTESSGVSVAVGPFSGVAAANGMVTVSGGTSALSVWRYDSLPSLSGPIASADFGRGQPDVLLTHSGLFLVSTHRWGPYFGLTVARFDGATQSIRRLWEIELPHAGFTEGGAKPANFPIESASLDDSTFAIAHRRGLSVVRVDRGSAAHIAGTVDVGGPAVNVDASGDTAAVVVAGRNTAIVLVQVRATPRVVKRIALPPGTIPQAVALTSHSVIVAAREQGVLVLPR